MNIEGIVIGLPVTFTTGSARARVVALDKANGLAEVELVDEHTPLPGGAVFPAGYKSLFPVIELRALH